MISIVTLSCIQVDDIVQYAEDDFFKRKIKLNYLVVYLQTLCDVFFFFTFYLR
jgi:hypothetical protein